MVTQTSIWFCRLLIVLVAIPGRAFSQGEAASLTIRFAGGISTFHAGEVIPIELSFTASLPDAYDINTRNYDRSGRLDMEQFTLLHMGATRSPSITPMGYSWGADWEARKS